MAAKRIVTVILLLAVVIPIALDCFRQPVTAQSKSMSQIADHAITLVVPPATLKVRAFIDGRSQLVIRGNEVYWHHLDWAAPGRHLDAEVPQPTYLNHVRWMPSWPDLLDTENRGCTCNSAPFKEFPILAKHDQIIHLVVAQGRGKVSVLQNPASNNDYTLIIEFDDNTQPGPDWYEIDLTYDSVAPEEHRRAIRGR
jgi:hypothetical protein